MINDAKFIKPINMFLRVVFFVLLIIKSRGATIWIDAILNDDNYACQNTEWITIIIAGGTLYETMYILILSIIGFVSTFGISRFKEWSRLILMCVLSLFLLLSLYSILSIFNLQIRDNFDSPIVDLSSAYLRLAWHLILCFVLGAIAYYFSQPNVRNVFKK
jgi:hypothetical protein